MATKKSTAKKAAETKNENKTEAVDDFKSFLENDASEELRSQFEDEIKPVDEGKQAFPSVVFPLWQFKGRKLNDGEKVERGHLAPPVSGKSTNKDGEEFEYSFYNVRLPENTKMNFDGKEVDLGKEGYKMSVPTSCIRVLGDTGLASITLGEDFQRRIENGHFDEATKQYVQDNVRTTNWGTLAAKIDAAQTINAKPVDVAVNAHYFFGKEGRGNTKESMPTPFENDRGQKSYGVSLPNYAKGPDGKDLNGWSAFVDADSVTLRTAQNGNKQGVIKMASNQMIKFSQTSKPVVDEAGNPVRDAAGKMQFEQIPKEKQESVYISMKDYRNSYINACKDIAAVAKYKSKAQEGYGQTAPRLFNDRDLAQNKTQDEPKAKTR